MANSKLSISNPPISIKSTPISLSDDTLKLMMIQSYESAQKNESKLKPSKCAGILLSIAGTLLVSLITSSFKSIGQIPEDVVRRIAIIVCLVCGIGGIALLIIRSVNRLKVSTEERDKSIQDIISKHMGIDSK